MTLAKELFGLSAIIVLAIYVNRLLIINGFKRDPHSSDKEMPIENQNCQFVDFDPDDEARISVKDIFVTEDLAFLTTAERETVLMFDLTEDLTDYDLPLFESTKVSRDLPAIEQGSPDRILKTDFKLMDYKPLGIDFGAIDGFQSDDGRLLIYVFNIATNSIEKFEYNSGLNVLKFKKTFVSDLMVNVNDIHAVGEDLIYFSIGQQFPSGWVFYWCRLDCALTDSVSVQSECKYQATDRNPI